MFKEPEVVLGGSIHGASWDFTTDMILSINAGWKPWLRLEMTMCTECGISIVRTEFSVLKET